MGKKRKHLSHEEIWDDSALVDSWDAALQEYQLYHSIHARGERVEDVLKAAEASDEAAIKNEEKSDGPALSAVNGLPDAEDLEDGEVEDDQAGNESIVATDVGNDGVTSLKEEMPAETYPNFTTATLETGDHDISEPVPQHGIPGALVNGVQDEGLKNLMMSWYYAGYYTGLYEGRQQSAATNANATVNEIPNGGAT